jgi:hypothetical protein
MALSFLYLMGRWLVDVLLGSLRSEHAKDVEIAVLHHQLSVLRRQVKAAEFRLAESALLALLSRAPRRSHWPFTLANLHREAGHDPAVASPAGDPQVDADPADAGCVEELDRVIRDLRNYIFGLEPGVLAQRHLGQALEEMVEGFQNRTGVVAIAEIDPDAATALAQDAPEVVQLVREALSNVSRHADVATCRVSLNRDPDANVVRLEIDGVVNVDAQPGWRIDDQTPMAAWPVV